MKLMQQLLLLVNQSPRLVNRQLHLMVSLQMPLLMTL